MALGLLVFAVGLVVFTASRLAGALTPLAAPPTTVALATPSPTPPPTPSPSPTATPEPTPTPTPPPTLEQLVGQKLIVRMDGRAPSKGLLARVRDGAIGGVILFRSQVRSEAQIRAATQALQAAATGGGQPPLLILTDQEGGGIRGLPWAQPVQSAARMGRLKDIEDVKALGAAAGLALGKLGINVDLAPVADVPGTRPSFMRDTLRTFSSDQKTVSSMIVAFAQGLASQDVAATAKHFPGLGRVARNTDRFAETVTTSRDGLGKDLAPFRAAIEAGIPMIMLSNATYAALDPDNAAGWSRAIATDLLRGEMGFEGVTITDGLNGAAAARDASARTLAALAARAGVDLVLLTGDEASSSRAHATLLDRAESGWLDRADLESSYARILALKATLGE
jgi:beta-N-acetylhexosaminidase